MENKTVLDKYRVTITLMKSEDATGEWQASAIVKTQTTVSRFTSTAKSRNMAYTRVMLAVLHFLMDD